MAGHFLISLDFELMWGMRDSHRSGDYRPNIHGARLAIPPMLDLFQRYEIGVTWATVGLLMAPDRNSMKAMLASASNGLQEPHFDALEGYIEQAVGTDESQDPLHFGSSLIDQIVRHERQELASHTFSHYCCLAPGASTAGFASDLRTAMAVSAERGPKPRSLVFARNQISTDCLAVLSDLGINQYRGNPASKLYGDPAGAPGKARRALGMADAFFPLAGSLADLPATTDACIKLSASRFLRPWSPGLASFYPLHLRRIMKEMSAAARRGMDYHLWWHPHNFGLHTRRQLGHLEVLLQHQRKLAQQYAWDSVTMAERAAKLNPNTAQEHS